MSKYITINKITKKKKLEPELRLNFKGKKTFKNLQICFRKYSNG